MKVLVCIRNCYFRLMDPADEGQLIKLAGAGININVTSITVDEKCSGGWHGGVYSVQALREADPESYPDERWVNGALILELSLNQATLAMGLDLIQVRPRDPLPDATNHL